MTASDHPRCGKKKKLKLPMLESLLIKLQVFMTENLLKRDSNTVALLIIIRNIYEHLF